MLSCWCTPWEPEVVGSLPHTWEIQTEFPAPKQLRSKTVDGKAPQTLSAFQREVNKLKKKTVLVNIITYGQGREKQQRKKLKTVDDLLLVSFIVIVTPAHEKKQRKKSNERVYFSRYI